MGEKKNDNFLSTITRRKYRVLKITVASVLLLICAFFGLQVGSRLYLEKWLVDNGADSAAIKSIRINPFIGQASLNGVDVEMNGKTVLGNTTIAVNIGLKQLFGHEALLQEVILKDVRLEFEQYEDGALRIGSYRIEPSTPDNQQEVKTAELQDGQIPWIVSASKVSLQNVIVHYRRPKLDVELSVEEGHLEDFTTDSNGAGARLFLKGRLNGAELLIDLEKLRVVPEMQLTGKVKIGALVLDDLADLLSESLPRFGGRAGLEGKLSFTMKDAGDIESSYKGTLQLDKIGLGQQAWSTQASTRWDGDITFAMGQKGLQVNTNGSLKIDDSVFTMGEAEEQLNISNAAINWSGKVSWQQDAYQQLLTTEGTLQTKALAGNVGSAKLKFATETLGGDINIRLNPSEVIKIAGTAHLGTESIYLELNGEPLFTLASLAVAGVEAGSGLGFRVAKLDAGNLTLPVSSIVPVGVKVHSLTLENVATSDLKTVDLGRLQIVQPEVMDGEGTTLLVRMGEINAQTLHLDEKMIVSVNDVNGSDSAFLHKEGVDPMATLAGITLADLSYSQESGLAIADMRLIGLKASTIIEKKEKAHQAGATVAEKQAEPPAEHTGFPVRISRLEVDDTSGFTFTDKTLSTPSSITLDLKSLLVEGIDLTDPGQAFTYTLKGTVNNYALLSIDGKTAPLGKHLYVSQKTKLQNMQMQAVSPYAIEAIGTFFPSGRLDLNSTLTVEAGRFNMENNLLFKELESKTVNDELTKELNNKLPVPLSLALSMLRKSDGTIDLNIPLAGEVSGMNVGISDIIITAVSKGITVAVTPYLAYTALGPTGALIFLGARIGQSLINTDLPSLQFEPGAVELTQNHINLLTSIGEAIIIDAKTSYSICAKVNKDELTSEGTDVQDPALVKKLFSLGEQRSTAVKSYLEKTFAIEEDRLLICNPMLNFEKGMVPSIEFKK